MPGDTDTEKPLRPDCDTAITLPFPVQILGQTYTSVNASSNGRLNLICANEPGRLRHNVCRLDPIQCSYDNTVFPPVAGHAPHMGLKWVREFPRWSLRYLHFSLRQPAQSQSFNIEWRTVLFG